MNPTHLKKYSHPKYNEEMIADFKSKADTFLDESYKHFQPSTQMFDHEWTCGILIIKAPTVTKLTTVSQTTAAVKAYYKSFESYYFLLIANIFLHLEEYCANPKYVNGPAYLRQLLFTFEEQSVTGTYTVSPISEVGLKLEAFKKTYPELDFDPTKFDNTTIRACIKYYAGIPDSNGGKTNKTHKRVKSIKRIKSIKSIKSIKRIKRKSNKSNKTHKRNKRK
jgi:hypothetical protein